MRSENVSGIAVDLAVENIGGDFRRGMAAFHAFDFEVSKRDRSKSTAAWHVDGRTVYEAHDTFIPGTRSPRVRDLDDAADPGRSQSLDRRAGHEREVGRFRVRGVGA